jgi:hypothetical protein
MEHKYWNKNTIEYGTEDTKSVFIIAVIFAVKFQIYLEN